MFTALDLPQEGTTVKSEVRQAAFFDQLRSGLATSLESESRLHGWRVQEMFAGMIVSLGRFQLLSFEDEGDCFYSGDEDSIRVPDFRLVTEEGEQLLVEVKNVPPREHLEYTMRLRDLEALERYAALTNARLLVAHYWAAANLWTLVDAASAERTKERATFRLTTAMKVNELGTLGDRWIGTTPPLTFSLTVADMGDEANPAEADEFLVRIEGAEVYCGGRRIEDQLEQNIAWRLMLSGDWRLTQSAQLASDGKLERIENVFAPETPTEGQEFEIVGTLSSMHAKLYTLATMTEGGEFLALRQEADPEELAELIPPNYWEKPDRVLRLWQFDLQPSRDGE